MVGMASDAHTVTPWLSPHPMQCTPGWLHEKYTDQTVTFYDYEESLKMYIEVESDSFSSISFNSGGGTFS